VALEVFCFSVLMFLTFVLSSPYSTFHAQQEAKRLMDLEDEYASSLEPISAFPALSVFFARPQYLVFFLHAPALQPRSRAISAADNFIRAARAALYLVPRFSKLVCAHLD
jgi:hypothetical protein